MERTRTRGFTLIDLLAAITVVAIPAAIMSPGDSNAQGALREELLASTTYDTEGQAFDTLDLVQNARASFNALTKTVDDRGEFMFACSIVPPSLEHDAFSFSACAPKYIESLAMMSVMTGLDINAPAPKKQIDYLMGCLGDDGLFYCKIGPERPWDNSSPEDWANIYGQGRMIRAMLAMYQLSGDDIWVERMKKLVGTLERIAIRKKDAATGETYAYYPTTPGYGDIFSYPKSGWKITELRTDPQETMAGMPDHSFGIPLYIGGVIEPLTRYAVTFHDKAALELAGEITRFELKKESAWMPDGHARGVIPEQNGQFYGHCHAHGLCLRGILEYGIATNDTKLKSFARSGYGYIRTFGIPRIGWFPEYTEHLAHETCGLANMIALAIKLSDAGLGDYWDDVDCYARNHLVQAQFTDLEQFKQANGGQLTDEQIELLKRLDGVFAGWGPPNYLVDSAIMNCCTANGSQALYYVWDGIVRHKDGVASVNLLLNRKSPWVDVKSALPNAGEVILRNKTCRSINIRIPAWVKRAEIRVRLNDSQIDPVWVGNYIVIVGLKGEETIELTFPVTETVERYSVDSYEKYTDKYLGRHDYTIHLRGNTAVAMEPAASEGWPVYCTRRASAREYLPTLPADYIAYKRIAW
jgi:hypothetical protein